MLLRLGCCSVTCPCHLSNEVAAITTHLLQLPNALSVEFGVVTLPSYTKLGQFLFVMFHDACLPADCSFLNLLWREASTPHHCT
jgi:hypothetical protein